MRQASVQARSFLEVLDLELEVEHLTRVSDEGYPAPIKKVVDKITKMVVEIGYDHLQENNPGLLALIGVRVLEAQCWLVKFQDN